ncbi:MAG TPA: prepilin-type N-terminal cleavage/methylation domain-containing protein [Deltaproteobacteria bacterium]|nr:prepilin-type N-terminal cleavage/methylation domain-containing protein [Deltaproteobacteria bacterium]HOM29067.1 prepilin-type N-terminal cleavage/methylation domain-containing protein [Deltaproteobacteria bacterium]HPP80261.1 prepilin-type N-terminal cleavage/methylation domain-containing protein [Deltaproteobacteria bacterium]
MRDMRCLSNESGVTLVELMVVLVLSMLLMGAVYMTFQLQHSSARAQTDVSAVQNDIRVAIDIVALDIMHAGLSTNPSRRIPGIPGGTSGAHTLTLQMDVDQDGALTSAGEIIVYSLDADGNLVRNDPNAGVTHVVANGVTALEFRYRGVTSAGVIQDIDPGAGTLDDAQAGAVRLVNVTITKQADRVDSQTGNPIQRTLSRWIARRNGAIEAL